MIKDKNVDKNVFYGKQLKNKTGIEKLHKSVVRKAVFSGATR